MSFSHSFWYDKQRLCHIYNFGTIIFMYRSGIFGEFLQKSSFILTWDFTWNYTIIKNTSVIIYNVNQDTCYTYQKLWSRTFVKTCKFTFPKLQLHPVLKNTYNNMKVLITVPDHYDRLKKTQIKVLIIITLK